MVSLGFTYTVFNVPMLTTFILIGVKCEFKFTTQNNSRSISLNHSPNTLTAASGLSIGSGLNNGGSSTIRIPTCFRESCTSLFIIFRLSSSRKIHGKKNLSLCHLNILSQLLKCYIVLFLCFFLICHFFFPLFPFGA